MLEDVCFPTQAVSFDTSSMPSGEEEQPGEGNDQVQPAPPQNLTAKEALEMAREQYPQLRAAVHAEQQRWAAQQALLQQAVQEAPAQENSAPEHQAGAEPSQVGRLSLPRLLLPFLAEDVGRGCIQHLKTRIYLNSMQGLWCRALLQCFT